mgnify:CR=1 FL=1
MDINFSDEEVRINNNKRLFLAGPTRRNSLFKYSWRNDVCEILSSMDYRGIVYVPEYKNDIQFDYNKQVLWERKALESATKILFWIPRNIDDDMPAFTTNVEFGMYLARVPDKVLLAYPKNAEKMEYLRWLYEYETGRKPYFNIVDALEEAIK